jgi:hypothetical protein
LDEEQEVCMQTCTASTKSEMFPQEKNLIELKGKILNRKAIASIIDRTHIPNPQKTETSADNKNLVCRWCWRTRERSKFQHPTIPTNKKRKGYMSHDPHRLFFASHQPPVNNNHSANPIPSNDKSQSTSKDGSLKQPAYKKKAMTIAAWCEQGTQRSDLGAGDSREREGSRAVPSSGV